jgi:hypothetical protein
MTGMAWDGVGNALGLRCRFQFSTAGESQTMAGGRDTNLVLTEAASALRMDPSKAVEGHRRMGGRGPAVLVGKEELGESGGCERFHLKRKTAWPWCHAGRRQLQLPPAHFYGNQPGYAAYATCNGHVSTISYLDASLDAAAPPWLGSRSRSQPSASHGSKAHARAKTRLAHARNPIRTTRRIAPLAVKESCGMQSQ